MSQDKNESGTGTGTDFYKVMVDAPDDIRVELFEQAKYPEKIALSTTVPALANNITIKNRADFEKEQNIRFSNLQIPSFVRDAFYQQNQGDFTQEAIELTAAFSHLSLGDMGKELGKGLFAKNSLNRDVHIPYGGKFIDVKTPDSGYKITYNSKKQALDAVKYRHFGAYAQHAPTKIPDEIEFLIPGLKETIATANAEFVHLKVGSRSIPALKLRTPVAANEAICWDYGDLHWHYRVSPRFIDRFGRAISRCLYRNDMISLISLISPSTRIVSFDRCNLLNDIKTNPNGSFNYFEMDPSSGEITPRFELHRDLKKIFEEKGYIPTGSYFKQTPANSITAKPIDWQREFRQAAHDGRVDDMEYILEWLVPPQKIEINASGQASGKSALHFAAEQGEIYSVYYLVMKGADLTLRDLRQKTALDLVHEQLAKQAQDRLHSFQEDYEKIVKYLSARLTKNDNHDVDTSVPASLNSFVKV